MPWPWKRSELDEDARLVRGRLAEEIVKNDRARVRLSQKSFETPVGDMLAELFEKLDEGQRRG